MFAPAPILRAQRPSNNSDLGLDVKGSLRVCITRG